MISTLKNLKPALLFGLCLNASFGSQFAGAQDADVRLWAPFHHKTQVWQCIEADLRDWQLSIEEELELEFLDHQLVALPEGRYIDQLNAARETGEHPNLALLSDLDRPAEATFQQGAFFGADMVGFWVDHVALAEIPDGDLAFSGLWSGDVSSTLAAFDDFLAALATSQTPVLGFDVGVTGTDLGLGLQLLLQQWTTALDQQGAPNWQGLDTLNFFNLVNRWQSEGIATEIDFGREISDEQRVPALTVARYSRGRALGSNFAFYPIFPSVEGKVAVFLDLPLHWYALEGQSQAFARQLIDDLELGLLFTTCAEAAGHISVEQRNQLIDGITMDLLFARQGQVLPFDYQVDLQPWDPRLAGIPRKVANVLRDMRAGLSVEAALNNEVQ